MFSVLVVCPRGRVRRGRALSLGIVSPRLFFNLYTAALGFAALEKELGRGGACLRESGASYNIKGG